MSCGLCPDDCRRCTDTPRCPCDHPMPVECLVLYPEEAEHDEARRVYTRAWTIARDRFYAHGGTSAEWHAYPRTKRMAAALSEIELAAEEMGLLT